MGKIITKKIKGMGWTAKISLVLLCTLLTSMFMYQGWYKPRDTQAAISQQQAWTNVYHAAANPGATAASFAVSSGTNRMLVVAIASSLSSSATETMTSVTYGGQAMTLAAGDAATSTRGHSYLYYLKDNAVMDGTAKTLAVTMTGSSPVVNDIYYAVYSGVDQSASPLTDAKNANNSSGSSTAVFGTALTVNANDQAVVIYNAFNSSSTTVPTVAVPTNFTQAATQTWNTSNGDTSKVVYRSVPSSNTTDTASSALGTSSRWSMSGMSMKAYAPTVTSASPSALAPGDSNQNVTITGTNFMNGATVSFSGTGITVINTTFNSATSMTVNVSVDAAAASGLRTVTVTNPSSQGSGSGNVFSVVSANAPTIATVTPSALGQGATGVNVAITGTNFIAGGTPATSTTVSVGGSNVTVNSVTVNSATTLTANLTVSGTAAVGARDLTVTNPDTSSSTKTGALTITTRPTVTSAAPLGGTLGWTGTVTITGTGFVSGTGLAASFSGTGITVNSTTYVSATSLTANITIDPAAAGGVRTITVKNPDFGTSAAGGSFTVITAPAPTISSISPTAIGQGATSKTYTIVGTNFVSGATVAISGSNVTTGTVTVIDAQTITVPLTASTSASIGARNVTVTNPDTQTVTATGVLTVNSRPGSTITAVPSILSTGKTTNVTLTGSGFLSGAVLTFGSAGVTAGPITFVNVTTLTADITVASNATVGATSVIVTNPDGGNRSVNSVLTITPVGVSSASPVIAQGATGNIIITGQGFAAGAAVGVSGTGVKVNSVQVVDAATLTANVTVVSGAAIGARDITVTVGANTGTGIGLFTIAPGPSIIALSPATLRQGDENKDVTISGANFATGCTVQFNGTGVTLNAVSFVSATELTANITIDQNAGRASQSVTVTNPDGGTAIGGTLTIALTGKTITGGVSFTKVTSNAISMVIAFSGDGDNDGSCSIAYGTTPSLELGTIAAVKANGAYSASFNNLTGVSEGVGRLYYFRVTFTDGDGIIGNSQIDVAQPTKGSQLLHNSQNTFSSKWSQGWGIDGGKYGVFICATCHNENTTNSQLVAQLITKATMENWSSTRDAGNLNVVYKKAMGDDSAHATSTNVCEVCHSRTNHHKYNNAGANHQGSADCTVCHSHNEGFLPSCQGCHSIAQGPGGYRRQIVGTSGDFFTNMSTHGKLTALNSQTCTVCHDATVHQTFTDGVSVALKNADTGAQVVYDGTTATAQNTAVVCISCHDADGATRLGSIAKAPFAASEDFRAPADINQYWPTANGAHAAKMQCMNCHGNSKGVDGSTTNPKYNAHASGIKHVLQDTAYDVVNPNSYCFNCHNAASTDPNKSSKNISAQFALTNKHVTAKCFDCHGDESNSLDSLHSLRAGSQTAGSGVIAKNISNATGRSMTWSLNTWGGATASTSLVSNAATAEYQVCFKCHAANGVGTTPDVPGAGTAAASLTNLALEFNPNNMSGHPIVTGLNNYPNSLLPKALTAAKMKAPWNVNLGTQVMTCSDCHATDTTASKGPHGSSVKWMLTGTNKAWPYTTTAGNGASTGTLFTISTYSTNNGTNNGLFCLNCHVVTGSNNFHSANGIASGQHVNNTSIPTCVSCHIRVPHGGDISRLLQTTNAPARYRATGNGGTPNFTGWAQTAGNVKGASAGSSNFRSSCSEHSGSGGEAW